MSPGRLCWGIGLAAAVGGARGLLGQAAAGSIGCDSIVQAARVDSMPVGLFFSVIRHDGGELGAERASLIAATISAAFAPPRPFRLTVFSGPPALRLLRTNGDTNTDLRSPTVAGVYRFWSFSGGKIAGLQTIRSSLMPGLDSAVLTAIASASESHVADPSAGEDSMLVHVRLSSDSMPGAHRFVGAYFPRMPVRDAVPLSGNPAPVFPAEARRDSEPSGDIVLRFVVDISGNSVPETVEVVRGHSLSFLKAALEALPKQRFTPATVHGCPVAQVIDYAFNFLNPDEPPRH